MNLVIFTGRLAAAVELKQHGETTVAKLRLIRNEYAGNDGQGNARERQVVVPFVAFGKKAQALADNVMKGDQLIVHASIENNNFTDGEGKERYDYNFKIDEFEFGAPGPEKRRQLEAARDK